MSQSYLEHDWFPAPLPKNVSLGDRNWLYSSFAFVHYRSRRPLGLQTGSDTGLYNGTFFDMGPAGELVIGRYCSLVGAIISCNSRVVIGDYTLIAHEVVLADSLAAIPPHLAVGYELMDRTENPETSIQVDQNVWIGARAILLRGAHIGEGSIVGAGAVVDFQVPPYSLVAGNPAKVVRRLE